MPFEDKHWSENVIAPLKSISAGNLSLEQTFQIMEKVIKPNFE